VRLTLGKRTPLLVEDTSKIADAFGEVVPTPTWAKEVTLTSTQHKKFKNSILFIVIDLYFTNTINNNHAIILKTIKYKYYLCLKH
jgi:hypothetical protein